MKKLQDLKEFTESLLDEESLSMVIGGYGDLNCITDCTTMPDNNYDCHKDCPVDEDTEG